MEEPPPRGQSPMLGLPTWLFNRISVGQGTTRCDFPITCLPHVDVLARTQKLYGNVTGDSITIHLRPYFAQRDRGIAGYRQQPDMRAFFFPPKQHTERGLDPPRDRNHRLVFDSPPCVLCRIRRVVYDS